MLAIVWISKSSLLSMYADASDETDASGSKTLVADMSLGCAAIALALIVA
jgi:hypothetical protein